MEMLNKMFRGLSLLVLFFVSFALSSRVAYGAWPDPEADLGVLRLLASGTVAWRVEVVSNALQFTDNVTSGLKQLRIFPNNGGLGLNGRTTTQLSTDVPGAAGALAFNSTTAGVCIATGTGGGAWVYVSSFTAAGGTKVVCN